MDDDELDQQPECPDRTVEFALMVARPGANIGPNVACVLAAEVRRLREYEIRLKLDEAGIATREKEAIELINLRAEVRRLREELASPDRRPDIVYERGYKAGRNETVESNLKRMEAERELFMQRKENDRLRAEAEETVEQRVMASKSVSALNELTAKLSRVEAERDLFRGASEAAEMKLVELKAEVERWKHLCEVRSNTAAARKLTRVEAAADEYDRMPDGRGYAGCEPKKVAEHLRALMRDDNQTAGGDDK